jgi:parallel beta helix pectate lyase-like protein
MVFATAVAVMMLGAAESGLAATQIPVDCGAGADLQAAIDAAPKGATLEISGTCVGTFAVGKNLALKGVSGAVLDARGGWPVLTVTAGKVHATQLTVTGGSAIRLTAGSEPASGIKNSGTLTLVHVTVQNNDGDGVGAIENLGSLTVQRSLLYRDFGDATGGISNLGTATIDHTTIDRSGEAGIRNAGTLTLTNSTVSHSGGTQDAGIHNSGTATIIRSTIAQNIASNGSGGGIINEHGATLTVLESTISGNVADESGGGILNEGSVTLASSIVAGNSSDLGDTPSDCVGAGFASNGYNVFGTPCGAMRSTDLAGTFDQALDAMLKVLGSYGGPTQTMVPKPTSPAVNRITVGSTTADGTTALCPASGTTDQRGIARPQSGACDIGSVERKPKE